MVVRRPCGDDAVDGDGRGGQVEDSDEDVDASPPPLRVTSNADRVGLCDAGPSRLGAPLRPGLYWHRPDDSNCAHPRTFIKSPA